MTLDKIIANTYKQMSIERKDYYNDKLDTPVEKRNRKEGELLCSRCRSYCPKDKIKKPYWGTAKRAINMCVDCIAKVIEKGRILRKIK